ncbi:chromosome partition protein Smc-like [Pocillopora verrucosa]|uniref:chromosome partition protein Smc-like n=1 Tax=Pocillopora verrucosa TaxID=203993 RepID=UPI0033413EA0
MSVKIEDWPKEKQVLLRSIKEKEERLKDFEKRFLPTMIEDERLILREKELEKDVDGVKSKIATCKQEIEVLKLRKQLKELEEENESLSSIP